MSGPARNQIWLMPWADLRNEIRIGPVSVQPYEGALRDALEPKMRDHLDAYLRRYVAHDGKPVSSIAALVHDDALGMAATGEQEAAIRLAADALAFAAIAPVVRQAVSGDHRWFAPPSADRFELAQYDFVPGDKHLSVVAGSAIEMGSRIDRVTFQAPFHLGGGWRRADVDLLGAFDAWYRANPQAAARVRVARCLEWFRHAHTETHQVPLASKVVMTAAMFEILLGAPDGGFKGQFIAEALEKNCTFGNSVRERRSNVGRRGPDGRTATGELELSRLAWWAWGLLQAA